MEKPNFIDENGNKILIRNYRSMYKDGRMRYYVNGKERNLKKIKGKVSAHGVKTPTKSR